jgi:aryl-alcohol dehydrogenase (NADP+)
VVKAGKARYIGASSMPAWRFAKAIYIARQNGWAPFVGMQNHLNLIYREEEREMLPFCIEEGISVIPWSPLARGRLARAWDETSARQETDEFGKKLYVASDAQVVDQVGAIAEARGVPRAQVALAWLAQKPGVTAPIIGASKPRHLDDAVAALSLGLTGDEIAKLEAPYQPHAVAGFA